MAIDPIGKKAPPAPSPETSGPARSGGAAGSFGPFEAPRAPAPAQAAPVGTELGALEQFRNGHLDLQGYLDLKVSEATAHLSALPPVQLDAIRKALRDRLAVDPALVDLVRAATGKVPEPPDGS